jgi:hypothetical protein
MCKRQLGAWRILLENVIHLLVLYVLRLCYSHSSRALLMSYLLTENGQWKKIRSEKTWVMSVSFTDWKWTVQEIIPQKHVCKVKMPPFGAYSLQGSKAITGLFDKMWKCILRYLTCVLRYHAPNFFLWLCLFMSTLLVFFSFHGFVYKANCRILIENLKIVEFKCNIELLEYIQTEYRLEHQLA